MHINNVITNYLVLSCATLDLYLSGQDRVKDDVCELKANEISFGEM